MVKKVKSVKKVNKIKKVNNGFKNNEKKAFDGLGLLKPPNMKVLNGFVMTFFIITIIVGIFGTGYLIYTIINKINVLVNLGNMLSNNVETNYRKELKNRMMGNKNGRMRFGSPNKIPPNSYVKNA